MVPIRGGPVGLRPGGWRSVAFGSRGGGSRESRDRCGSGPTAGSGALADGQRAPVIDAPLAIHLIVNKGIGCLGNLGWDGLDTSDVPRESSPEVQREVGRCLGILDAAIMHSERALPPELYEQQAGLYLVTLRPSLVGYAECLAGQCSDLETWIEAVHTTMWPVDRVLRDVIIDDH